jgi:hypothetical protein
MYHTLIQNIRFNVTLRTAENMLRVAAPVNIYMRLDKYIAAPAAVVVAAAGIE